MGKRERRRVIRRTSFTTTMSEKLDKILDLTKSYATARQVLTQRAQTLESELAEIQRRRIAGLRAAADTVASLETILRAEISAAPELFARPRTLTSCGVTIGYSKGRGRIAWDDNDKVIALIRRHLPDQAAVLILTEERPSADALKNLEARDLARIGARVEGSEDTVVVKPADSGIGKLVKRILEEAKATSSE